MRAGRAADRLFVIVLRGSSGAAVVHRDEQVIVTAVMSERSGLDGVIGNTGTESQVVTVEFDASTMPVSGSIWRCLMPLQ